MAVKKMMRAVDLVLQFIIALQQQLLREGFAVLSFVEHAPKLQRIERKPDLHGVAIDFMN